MGLYDYTIYDFICRNAQIYKDRVSILYKDTRLTHSEFKNKCDRLAAGLSEAGIQTGDRIGIVAQNSLEFVELYGAAAKIGAIVLPVNWRFQQDEVEYVLNDCTPKIILASPDFHDTVSEVVKKISSIEKCYTIDTEGEVEGFSPFSELYSDDISDDKPDIPADSGFVIIHTAAVAGKPRGALLSQANVICSNLLTMENAAMDENDCHVGVLPLFHIAGLNMTMATMHAGGKNAVMQRFDPELACKLIDEEKGTTLFNFAPILKMIMDIYDQGSYDFSSLKYVSGMDSPENIQRFLDTVPNAEYWTGFGQTQAMGVSSCRLSEKPGCAGKPTILAKVALFDDYDQEVSIGEPGEICVRSPTVFLGYWGLDEDNEQTFRNGWHHTGDIGRFDEDGYLWYVKRKAEKELIKPGGENVYPTEVEKVIMEHDAVKEVTVIGVSDPDWGEAIKAVCALNEGASVEAQEIIDFVASKIARYKKPKHVVFVDALPKTDDGEIDRDTVKKEHGAKY